MPNFDRRTLALLPFAGLGLAALAPAARAQTADLPSAIVQRIMASYSTDKPLDLRLLPYTPAIRQRIGKAEIDADFIIDGQDFQLTDLVISQETIVSAKRRLVVASFKNFDEPRVATFDFEEIGGVWLIAEIRQKNGFSLRKMLNLAPRP